MIEIREGENRQPRIRGRRERTFFRVPKGRDQFAKNAVVFFVHRHEPGRRRPGFKMVMELRDEDGNGREKEKDRDRCGRPAEDSG